MVAADDVAFLHRLGDAADAVSLEHFRSEALRTTTKVDGTPVSEVGDDGVLGEEVGAHPGTSSQHYDEFDHHDGHHHARH